MTTLNDVLPFIAALAYMASAIRLACYNRGTAQFRRYISLLASLFGASLCLSGLEIVLYRPPVSLWHTTTAVLLCILIFRSRGNVATLLRTKV